MHREVASVLSQKESMQGVRPCTQWGMVMNTQAWELMSQTNAPLTLSHASTTHRLHALDPTAVCPKLKVQNLNLQVHAVREYCHFLNLTTTQEQTILSVTTKPSFCPRDLNSLCRRV